MRACDWIAVIFAFTCIPALVDGIRCYKCEIASKNIYLSKTLLCHDFDYSEKFIVDCPYSTYCMKTDFTINLSVPVNTTTRDCAPQKNSTQIYDEKDKDWKWEYSIGDPYTTECIQVNDGGQRIIQPLQCYCKGDLCNLSFKNHASFITIALLLLVSITGKYALF